jgi:4-carboxymuconolactone decarboxylase
MTNDAATDRYAKGSEVFRRVYGPGVPKPPRGYSVQVDAMIEQLFAEVWGREGLSIRDRRLLVMGALAAQGQSERVTLQLRRAVEAGEVTLDEAEEIVLQLTHYIGWGLASSLSTVVPVMRAELAAEGGGS